jgi:hypothetical protein
VPLVILFAALLWAQGTVVFSGRITDAATGQPIEEAAITLYERAHHASQLTDANGNFSLEDDIEPGAGPHPNPEGRIHLISRSNPDVRRFQFSEGFSTLSITIISTGARPEYSLNPNCSRSAVNRDGAAVSFV